MTDPQVIVEVAFANDASAPATDLIWVDVSADVRAVDITRGRNQELDAFQAGRASVVLSNADRTYDPTNAAGPYVDGAGTQILPMKRVRIRTATEPMFEGYVDTWRQVYSPPNDAVAVLEATDGFKVLAQTEVNLSPFALEIADETPTYWFKLNETAGSTQVFDSVNGVIGTVAAGGVLGETGLLFFDNSTAYDQTEGNTAERISIPGAGIINNLPAQSLKLNQDGSGQRNLVSAPSSGTMDGYANGIDIRARLVRPATWNTSFGYLLGKDGNGPFGYEPGYYFRLYQNTRLSLTLSGAFANTRTIFPAASIASLVSVGQLFWAGATATNTSGTLWTYRFYINTATVPPADITTWTLLHTEVGVDLGSGTLASNGIGPCVGASGYDFASSTTTMGASGLDTNILEVQLRNNVNGTLVANPQFSNSGQWTIGETTGDTGTDAQGHVWTIRRQSPQPAPIIVAGTALPFSVEVLLRTTDATVGRVAAFQGTATGTPVYWALGVGAGGFAQATMRNGATTLTVLGDSFVINDGEIHFVSMTYDAAGVLRLYVDGVLDASGTQALVMSEGDLFIGNQDPDGTNTNWVGTIDEVVIYSRQLSAASVLEHYNLTTTPWQGDTTGARLARVLDAVGWPADRRILDAGDAAMQSQTLIGTALDLAQNVAESELFGSLFIARDGSVRFIDRSGQYGLASQATFSDALGAAGGLNALEPDFGDYLLRNYALIQRLGGSAQTAEEGGSVARYFRQSFSATGLNHDSDELSLMVAEQIVQQYAQPQLRVSQVTILPRQNPAVLFPTVLGLELGDWIDIEWTPQGVGAPIIITSVIEQITHSISQGQKEWRVTFNLSPAPVGLTAVPVTTGDAPPAVGAPVPTNASLDGRVLTLEGTVSDTVVDIAALQNPATIRLTSTGDASLSSTAHGFQVGATAGNNVIIDPNEIMARNNGATSPLLLNNDGGDVNTGANLNVGGALSAGNLDYGTGTTSAVAGVQTVTVNFSAAFQAAPGGTARVIVTPNSSSAAGVVLNTNVGSITSSSFQARIERSTATSTDFSWIAIK